MAPSPVVGATSHTERGAVLDDSAAPERGVLG